MGFHIRIVIKMNYPSLLSMDEIETTPDKSLQLLVTIYDDDRCKVQDQPLSCHFHSNVPVRASQERRTIKTMHPGVVCPIVPLKFISHFGGTLSHSPMTQQSWPYVTKARALMTRFGSVDSGHGVFTFKRDGPGIISLNGSSTFASIKFVV